MKRLAMFFLAGIVCSCNNEGTTSNDAMKHSSASGTSATPINYPYTIEHPDN